MFYSYRVPFSGPRISEEERRDTTVKRGKTQTLKNCVAHRCRGVYRYRSWGCHINNSSNTKCRRTAEATATTGSKCHRPCSQNSWSHSRRFQLMVWFCDLQELTRISNERTKYSVTTYSGFTLYGSKERYAGDRLLPAIRKTVALSIYAFIRQ